MPESNIITMPALALRGLAVFPQMLLHFDVGREASIKSIDEALAAERPLFLVAQRDLTHEEPDAKQLFSVGTVSKVRQILRLPGNNMRVLVEGVCRGQLVSLVQTSPYYLAQVAQITPSPVRSSARTEALVRRAYAALERYIELSPRMSVDLLTMVVGSSDPGYIADYIAQNISLRVEDKQTILEELRPVRRLERLLRALEREVEILEFEDDLQSRTHDRMMRTQRDLFLREQMKVIQSELGDGGGAGGELGAYRAKLEKATLPAPVRERLNKELSHLERQPPGSHEATLISNYLDVCLDLPWGVVTKDRLDVAAARRVLEADHFGMQKVKERILEFLSVKQLSPDLKGQILCLVGPPGVGKTSVGGSVARALKRKIARISLGGLHDEAEIRGHRKTYIGAMPGRIIAGIRQAGSQNPVLLLDEIDKVGADYKGDPAAALLEVLDTEQNATFRDNYLELPFDLSDVLFVTTANTTETIPRPLLDRMEVIELTSYTDEEKLQIVKRHLLPKQRKKHGLTARQLRLTDDAIREIIVGYTREAGVRILERQMAAVCRKAAMRIVSNGVASVSLTGDTVANLLGPPRFHPERLPKTEQIGVVNGLAWTQTGGELLAVEVNVVPGSGKVELTGNLGDVMKESAHAALSYLRGRADRLGLEPDFHKTRDLHVHFPEGAVPKDGPSAGIAIATAMISALTATPVKRGIAMTGEITLRGRVLPIGGLREKTMAALRNGIHSVILPAENIPDLEEIDQTVRAALQFFPVEHVDDVLAQALSIQVCGRQGKPPVTRSAVPDAD